MCKEELHISVIYKFSMEKRKLSVVYNFQQRRIFAASHNYLLQDVNYLLQVVYFMLQARQAGLRGGGAHSSSIQCLVLDKLKLHNKKLGVMF